MAKWSEIEDRAMRRAWEGVQERQRDPDPEERGKGYCRKHHRHYHDECPLCVEEIENHLLTLEEGDA